LESSPDVPAEAALPSQASPAPAGKPAKDPPPSLFVPVAPPPTIAPPGPAHWFTGALPEGLAPIPLPPGQNSMRYSFVSLTFLFSAVRGTYFGSFTFVIHFQPEFY